jgi:CrcB protein
VTTIETLIPRDGRRVWYEHRVQVFDRSTPFAPHVLGAVALGGAIGAAGRWAVARGVESMGWTSSDAGWPWATLIVNVVGCALIGLAARRLHRYTTAWAFSVTGVLGGFTTFSALAVELNDLADADRLPLALLYAGVTLVAGVGATMIAGGTVEVAA